MKMKSKNPINNECKPENPVSVWKAVFSRTFIAIAIINFLEMTGYYALFVTNTQYAVDKFDCSLAFAGLITGIVVIGCLVGRFFTGRIVNSAGFRRLLFIGISVYFIGNLSFLFVTSASMLLILRFVYGLAVGIVGTVAGTLVAVITPKAFQGRGISYYSMSTALAICFGPLLGISLLKVVGYEGIFWITIALSAVCLLLFFLIDVKEQPKKTIKKKIELSDFIDVKLIPFCLVCAIFCLAWGNIQAFISPYSHENHVETAASFFFLIYAGAILISRPWTGKIYDIHGPALVFYPAMLSLAAGLILLWAQLGSFAILIAGALCGFGFGNITSIGNAMAVSMVPKNRYAQATSSYFVFFDLGIGLAPYLSGYLVPYLGYTGVFGVTAMVVVIAIPFYYVVTKFGPKPITGEQVEFESNNSLRTAETEDSEGGAVP